MHTGHALSVLPQTYKIADKEHSSVVETTPSAVHWTSHHYAMGDFDIALHSSSISGGGLALHTPAVQNYIKPG